MSPPSARPDTSEANRRNATRRKHCSEAVGIARSRRPFCFSEFVLPRPREEQTPCTQRSTNTESLSPPTPTSDLDIDETFHQLVGPQISGPSPSSRPTHPSRCAPPGALRRRQRHADPPVLLGRRPQHRSRQGDLRQVQAGRELPRGGSCTGRAVGRVGWRAHRERAHRGEQAAAWPSTQAPQTDRRRRRGAHSPAPRRLSWVA